MKRVSKTLYEKRGKKYIPVGKDDFVMPYGFGDYLVRVRKGSTSITTRRVPVSIDYAKVEIALAEAADAITKAIMDESELQPGSRMNTPKEMEAFEAYKRIAGKENLTLYRKSAHDIAMAAVVNLRRELIKSRDGKPCPAGSMEVFAEREPQS